MADYEVCPRCRGKGVVAVSDAADQARRDAIADCSAGRITISEAVAIIRAVNSGGTS